MFMLRGHVIHQVIFTNTVMRLNLTSYMCEDNYWIDDKFWQRFLSNVYKDKVFLFPHGVYVFNVFKLLTERF